MTALCPRLARTAATLVACLLAACAAAPRPPPTLLAEEAPPSFAALTPDVPGAPAHLVLVTIAGLEPRHYLEREGSMPTLLALAEAGVAAERVDAVVPPAVYPAHATLVTGLAPQEHGVRADRLLGERGVRRERASHVSLLEGTTLWQQVAARGGAVAALDWPSTLGAAIPLLVPDVVPARRGEQWAEIVARASSPAMAPLLAGAPAEAGAPGAERDAWLVSAACTLLRSPGAPRLLLLRMSGTEVALARGGPHGAEARAAFAAADGELENLLRCLAEGGHLERGALAVGGDRAPVPVHSALRPNALLAQANLLATARDGGVDAWRALVRSNGGSAFVYARDAESAVAARRLLDEEASRTGAFRVVRAEEMIAREADPEAWFGLEAELGFVFLDDAVGAAVAPAVARAAGGYLLGRPELSPGFVAFGRGVRRGIRVPAMRQLDVAPTLARLLGVELAEARGRTLSGLLQLAVDVAAPQGEQLLEPLPGWSGDGGAAEATHGAP
jgi:hypothetical protein